MALTATIAELMLEKGRAQAAGALGAGQAWSGALQNIGQGISQIPQQIQQQKAQQQESQLRGIQVDEAQRRIDAEKAMDAAFAGAIKPDGTLDDTALLQHLPGHLVPSVMQNLNAVKKSALDISETHAKLLQQNQDLAAGLMNGVKNSGYDPKLFLAGLKTASANGLMSPDEATQHAIGAIEQGPDYVKSVTDDYINKSQAWQKIGSEQTTANARAISAQTGAERLQAELPNITLQGQKLQAEIPNVGLQGQKLKQEVSGTAPLTAYEQAQLKLAQQRLGVELRKQSFDESQGFNTDDPKAQGAIDMLGTYMATTGTMPAGFRVYGKNSPQFYTAVAANAAQKIQANGASLATNAGAFAANKAALVQQQKMYDSASAFLATADRNSSLLEGTLKKIPDIGSPVFNKPLRAFELSVAGDPNLSQFATYLTSVQNEYAKIITNPNLVGQLTDQSRREAQTLLDPEATVPQIIASVQALRKEGNNRLQSVGEQIQTIRGRMGESGSQPPVGIGSNPNPQTLPKSDPLGLFGKP